MKDIFNAFRVESVFVTGRRVINTQIVTMEVMNGHWIVTTLCQVTINDQSKWGKSTAFMVKSQSLLFAAFPIILN